jgi:hypothetical protein
MKKLFILTLGFLILAVPLAVNAISFDLFTYTGDPAHIRVDITSDTDYFQFDLSVLPYPAPDGNIGDLRGFWFNIDPFPAVVIPNTFITGPDVTDYLVSNDNVQNFNPTITPIGPFDVGVEFGTPGIATDDIQNTYFRVNHLGGLITLDSFITQRDPIANSFFAARLTSVGLEGGDREGSSKLVVPEPTSMLLLGSGLIGFAVIGRRKFFKKA